MKKLIALLSILLMLTCWSAKASPSCGTLLTTNTKVTAQYGITVTVFKSSTYVTIPPGSSQLVGVSDGDLVLVQASNYVCGSLSELQWGYTTWTHCFSSDAPVPVVMGGDFTMDWYVGREWCVCPAPGYGILVDTYSGYQCQQLSPPQK